MEQSRERMNGDKEQVIELKPIGIVTNLSKDASWETRLGKLDWQERSAVMKEQSDSISEIVIDSTLGDALDGIEDFSHLLVLYWSHLVPIERRYSIKVHPIGNKDFPLVGLFATRSPIRPNSILATVVRLLERDKNILKVTGMDALNGSPVLDIKPYYPESINAEEVRVPEWMRKVNNRFDSENK